jgi:hypothetical protein
MFISVRSMIHLAMASAEKPTRWISMLSTRLGLPYHLKFKIITKKKKKL